MVSGPVDWAVLLVSWAAAWLSGRTVGAWVVLCGWPRWVGIGLAVIAGCLIVWYRKWLIGF